ncbi:MAG: hypothetical protein ACYCZF_08925 [Anaerolineae bacterium]
MGFFDKLRKSLGGGAQKSGGSSSGRGDPNGIWFYFRCKKCGTPVRVRVDRRSDLNPEDGPAAYVVRKDVMDSKCFQLIKAEMWLDTTYSVVQADIRGGTLISEEEYQAALKPSGT